MNPVAIVHLVAAVVAIVVAIPLTLRRVRMNHWYGVRIPAAFESEEAWFDINQYGGRLLILWGIVIAITASIGAFLGKKAWVTYDWAAPIIVIAGLILVIWKIFSFARKRKNG